MSMVDAVPEKRAFYEEPFPAVTKMSRKDLEAELQNWRNLWTWLDMEVKGWLIRVGHKYRFVRRDYRVFIGTLGKVHFDAKLLELDCAVEEKDYVKKRLFTFLETMTIPLSQLVDWEEVHYEESVKLNTLGEVEAEAPPDDAVPDLV